jgi:hypothetical protein
VASVAHFFIILEEKHMNFRRVIAAIFAVCLGLLVVGCSNGTSKKDLEAQLEDMDEDEFEDAILEGAEKIDEQNEDSSESNLLNGMDPFEYLTVSYTGIAPYGEIELNTTNNSLSGVNFDADVTSGLSNGDIVTITATGSDISETEREFTVEGLPEYLRSIDDIDDDVMKKMQNQASNNFISDAATWSEGNSLHTPEFIGCYLLTVKDGFTASPYSKLYLIYKNTATVTGLKRDGDGETEEVGDETYYTYCEYDDIMILPDGTISVDLSSAQMCDNYIESDYGYWNFGMACFYYYSGYKELDSLFSACVTQQIANYDYVSTVTE